VPSGAMNRGEVLSVPTLATAQEEDGTFSPYWTFEEVRVGTRGGRTGIMSGTGPLRVGAGRVIVGVAVVAAATLLAACGSSGTPGPSTAGTAGSSKTPSSSSGSSGGTTTTTAPTPSSTRAPTPHATSVPGASELPTRAQLGSLTNYTYTYTINSVAMAGKVHSRTDFQTTQPAVILHIDGVTYTNLATTWYRTAQPANVAHEGYATSPYPGVIENFLGFLKVSGAAVTKGAACSEAGQAGTTFTIGSKELNSSVLSELATACIADHGGAMLAEGLGAQGSGVANSTHTESFSFTIDSIGNVPAIAVPSPVKTDS